jgi:hypothetical protein
MDEQLLHRYHRHVAMAYDRRLRLAAFRELKAPGEKWRHDVETATMFLGKLALEAPVLGTRQEHNNSWLWAWSDRNLRLTVTNRALGDTVRMLVHRLAVHQLGAAGFLLEPLLGSRLSPYAPDIFGVILSAELGYDGYHLIDRGRTTVLIRDPRLKFTEKHPLSRILAVFPKIHKALPVLEHKAAFINYGKDYGVTVAVDPGVVRLTEGKGELIATFDHYNQLVRLDGNVQPEKKSPRPAARTLANTARAKPAKSAAKLKKPITKKKPAAKKKPVAKKKPAKKR